MTTRTQIASTRVSRRVCETGESAEACESRAAATVRPSVRRVRRGLAAVVMLALAGCGGDARPRPAGPPAPAVTLTVLTGASPYAGCGRNDPSVQRDAEVEPHLAVS